MEMLLGHFQMFYLYFMKTESIYYGPKDFELNSVGVHRGQ